MNLKHGFRTIVSACTGDVQHILALINKVGACIDNSSDFSSRIHQCYLDFGLMIRQNWSVPSFLSSIRTPNMGLYFILAALWKVGIYVNSKKSVIFLLLRHHISQGDIEAKDKKANQILNWPSLMIQKWCNLCVPPFGKLSLVYYRLITLKSGIYPSLLHPKGTRKRGIPTCSY